jgi:hypothetical protein
LLSSDVSGDCDRRGETPPELSFDVGGERRPLVKLGAELRARDGGVEASSFVQDCGDDKVVAVVRELLIEAVVAEVVIEELPSAYWRVVISGLGLSSGGRRGREFSFAKTFGCKPLYCYMCKGINLVRRRVYGKGKGSSLHPAASGIRGGISGWRVVVFQYV